MVLAEIHELRCEHCGKLIRSVNENQAMFNMNAHRLSCEEKLKRRRKLAELSKQVEQLKKPEPTTSGEVPK